MRIRFGEWAAQPTSIKLFAWLGFLAAAMGAGLVRLYFDIFPATVSLLVCLLVPLICGFRSRIAMWVYVALEACLVTVLLYHSSEIFIKAWTAPFALELGSYGTQILATALLFVPSARRWMRREPKDDGLKQIFS